MDKESICRSSSLRHIRAQILLQKLLEVHHVTFEVMDVNDNMLVSQTKNISLELSKVATSGTGFCLESAQDANMGISSLRFYLLSPNDCFILWVETQHLLSEHDCYAWQEARKNQIYSSFCQHSWHQWQCTTVWYATEKGNSSRKLSCWDISNITLSFQCWSWSEWRNPLFLW